MIDDVGASVQGEVQKDYIRHVRTFTAFLGRSPDTATKEDLRRFQLHLAQQQIAQVRSTPPSPRFGSSSP